MKKQLLIVLAASLLGSCATIFNSRTEDIDIYVSEPAKLIVEGDTIPYEVKQHGINVDRGRQPIHFTLFNDRTSKEVCVPSKLSPAYLLNFFSPYWLGFLVDLTNQKRFNFPRTLYVDMEAPGRNYLPYQPWDSIFNPLFVNNLKVTPLKSIRFINAGLEVGYERVHNKRFSSQLSASYLFPMSVWETAEEFNPGIMGFDISVEEKFYFNRPAPNGIYTSLELSYLNSNYNRIYWFADPNLPDTMAYMSYSDSVHIEKQTCSLNLKLGYQYLVKRFSFEVFIGLGVRYKDVKHFDRIRPEDRFERPRHLNFFDIADKEGQYFTVSIPLSFKIGWTF